MMRVPIDESESYRRSVPIWSNEPSKETVSYRTSAAMLVDSTTEYERANALESTKIDERAIVMRADHTSRASHYTRENQSSGASQLVGENH